MDKSTQQVICVAFANGKCHDYKLYKRSELHPKESTIVLTDTGYLGLQKAHYMTLMPKKKSKKKPLTKNDKRLNRMLSSDRVENEHVIGRIKRFKILSDRYRNRRKRFGLRFNLIAGICNYEVVL